MNELNIAVVTMPTVFADVEANMEQAEKYVKEAKSKGAKLIVFPEFFTTGFAVNDKLISAIANATDVRSKVAEWSKTYDIAIGGSYLYPDYHDKEVYNEFGLFFPNGEAYYHKKDIPTGLENFCYTGGDEISAFQTPLGRIGVVMCWEQLRYQTVKRMLGKIDFLVGGSCWWGFAPEDGEKTFELLGDYNRQLAQNAPIQLAKIMGVPFIHASHSGCFPGLSVMGTEMCVRQIESRTAVINAEGEVVLREQEAGCFVHTIQLQPTGNTVAIPENRYWIPDLLKPMEDGFYMLNEQWKKIYEEKVKQILFQK